METEMTLHVTKTAAIYIINALARCPYGEVAQLIENLSRQIKSQEDADLASDE